MSAKRLRAAEEAAALVLGIPAERVFAEVNAGYVIVNWQESMACESPQREAVREAVRAALPPALRDLQISIV